ncbi:metalloendoproteinase 1-MMP-like [Punica granatum]|uniref:Uncharacterized protein n=2 Tax=Punica granatum TaxID=22663 RepID=A0A2I0K6C4_PUNGR|nr:metalloendoproteinase 1-MMP-like [Punica granatum]PKI64077.1 hypothetical protein CRG98_015521 [Punica granatum]
MASSFKPFRSYFLFFLLIVLAYQYGLCSRNIPRNQLDVKNGTRNTTPQRFDFSKFSHAGLGSKISGMSQLKRYLHRFGYLAPRPRGSNFSDDFDVELESALFKYQKRLGLQGTGRVDPETVASLMSPRCSVRDIHDYESPSSPETSVFHVTKNYKILDGRPIWNLSKPMTLKYAFYPDDMFDYLSQEEIRAAFAQAFAKWAEVIPVKFEETSDYLLAEVAIGFFKEEHGDGSPFDGPLGVLAHAFPYPIGDLHLDADENWAVDFKTNRAPRAIDLESVAIHEIGHVLGLDHSSLKESVMYPSITAMTKKVDLTMDDVEGIQMLYGPNPNMNLSSLVQTHSSVAAVGLQRRRIPFGWTLTLIVALLS